jgi:hypothetical protein
MPLTFSKVLPALEQYSNVILWLNGESDMKSWEDSRVLSAKLNQSRCALVKYYHFVSFSALHYTRETLQTFRKALFSSICPQTRLQHLQYTFLCPSYQAPVYYFISSLAPRGVFHLS